MRVFLTVEAGGARSTRLVPGPADLQGLTAGTVQIEGPATDADRVRWEKAVGLFVLRGGSARWLA